MQKQELHVDVIPDESLHPEWAITHTYLTQSSEMLQTEIFNHFSDSPASWLLFLGFCKPNVTLSPSLSFSRRFSGHFIRQLTRTPDLESLREQMVIDISPEALSGILAGVPMMSGAEYITRDLLQDIWSDLALTFSTLIRS